jgi:hypothetical protein
MMAAMIGGGVASRAVAKVDLKLSNQILQELRRIVGKVGGEGERKRVMRGAADLR